MAFFSGLNFSQAKGRPMHDSAKILLIDEKIIPVVGIYDPHKTASHQINGNGRNVALFKTYDSTLKKGDFVVVRTSTRHNMTVVEIKSVGLDAVDDVDRALDEGEEVKWVVGKVDTTEFEQLDAQEKHLLKAARVAKRKRERTEFLSDLGVGSMEELKALAAPVEVAPTTPASDSGETDNLATSDSFEDGHSFKLC